MRRRPLAVLHIGLDEEIVEGKTGFARLGRPSREDLQRIIRTIRRAASDRRVSGLLLRIAQPGLGWAKAASLARAIRDFRAAGKPTAAFLEGGGNIDFMLASSCENVVMPPGAILYLAPLRAEVFFFKDLLESVGIEAQLDAVGEYKSAGEMFLRREMSGPHREEVEALLADLSDQMAGAIARGRSLDPARVLELIDGGPYLAPEARDAGLIDRVAHEDDCESLLGESLGAEVGLIPHGRYRLGDGLLTRLVTPRRPQIAVVYAVGLIGAGEERRRRSPRPVLGARTLARTLKRVRDSSRVKAVVLRIDSPGGAAPASEQIWREIELTRQEKPVVVSMGDVAASGGYYIATAADAIFAEASTLTGSIGIVGGKVVARWLLDKLGIHRETVSTSRRSGFLSPFQPFTEEDRQKLRRHLLYFYEELFLPRVAAGRRMPLERAHEVGRGRVWTGQQGKACGLVDEIGDLDAAVDLARQRAGLAPEKKVRVVTYARRARLRDLLPLAVPWSEGMPARWVEVLSLLDLFAEEEALYLMPALIEIE